MSKIEKALEVLDALWRKLILVRKKKKKSKCSKKKMGGDTWIRKKMMPEEEEKGDYSDDEAEVFLSTSDGAGVEIGEPADRIVIDNGNPKASDLPVVKAFNNEELETLDLTLQTLRRLTRLSVKNNLKSWLTITCKV